MIISQGSLYQVSCVLILTFSFITIVNYSSDEIILVVWGNRACRTVLKALSRLRTTDLQAFFWTGEGGSRMCLSVSTPLIKHFHVGTWCKRQFESLIIVFRINHLLFPERREMCSPTVDSVFPVLFTMSPSLWILSTQNPLTWLWCSLLK